MVTELQYDLNLFKDRFYIDPDSKTGIKSKISNTRRRIGEDVGSIKRDPDGYETWVTQIGKSKYTISRIILVLSGKSAPDKYVDHIDGNSLNNSLDNLRYVDAKQSAHNRKVKEGNNSGVTGVYFLNKKQRTYVIAKWTDFLTGKLNERTFSVRRYGIMEAFKMAFIARQQATQINNLNGATYKEV